MKIFFFSIITLCVTSEVWSQDVFAIINCINAKYNSECISFGYGIRVENIKDSVSTLLDEGTLIVNNTIGKYDDFLYISHLHNDTFCFVIDTLLMTSSGLIRKDHDPKVLQVRLGTSQMFFRCFSSFFRNELKIINPERWDNIKLDSLDEEFYYLILYATTLEDEVVLKKKAQVKVDKTNFNIIKYDFQLESRGTLLNNVFTFSDWTSSQKQNESVYSIFEKIAERSNNPEYLRNYPTTKMSLDQNRSLSLDDLSIIDSLDVEYRIGDLNSRYIIIYFWFQGCYHCKHVGPVIDKFYKTNMREDITYLGIDFMSKTNESLLNSIHRNQYDFPNFRYNNGVKDFTVRGAPMVVIYDNLNNKILHQLIVGGEEYEINFSKLINAL